MAATVTLLVTRSNGLPEAIEVPIDELRKAILKSPTILLDTLKAILEPTPSAGLEPGQGSGVGLPADTPVYKMVPPDQASKFSPAAMKLTKSDLIALGGWGGTRKLPGDLGLAAEDIQTIRDVFSTQLTSGRLQGVAGFACCCCPCCSAAAVLPPLRQIA
jgi:hypothetical protein